MLRPSYAELMEVINKDSELDDKITSSYAIVIAAAKRARQIVDGAIPLSYAATDKAVSVAINEIFESRIRVTPESALPAAEEIREGDIPAEGDVLDGGDGYFDEDADEIYDEFDAGQEIDGEDDILFDDDEFDGEISSEEYADAADSDDYN